MELVGAARCYASDFYFNLLLMGYKSPGDLAVAEGKTKTAGRCVSEQSAIGVGHVGSKLTELGAILGIETAQVC